MFRIEANDTTLIRVGVVTSVIYRGMLLARWEDIKAVKI